MFLACHFHKCTRLVFPLVRSTVPHRQSLDPQVSSLQFILHDLSDQEVRWLLPLVILVELRTQLLIYTRLLFIMTILVSQENSSKNICLGGWGFVERRLNFLTESDSRLAQILQLFGDTWNNDHHTILHYTRKFRQAHNDPKVLRHVRNELELPYTTRIESGEELSASLLSTVCSSLRHPNRDLVVTKCLTEVSVHSLQPLNT